MFMASFIELERRETLRELNRGEQALRGMAAGLAQLAGSWSQWDDAYSFILDGNQAFIDSNLDWQSLESESDLNLILFVALDGRVVAGGGNEGATTGPIPRRFAGPQIERDEAFQRLERTLQGGGILSTEFGPLLLTIQPILPTNGQGEIRGHLIMGRWIDRHVTEQLALVMDCRNVLLRAGSHRGVELDIWGDDLLTTSREILDADGLPALRLRLTLDRPLVAIGRAVTRTILGLLGLSWVLVCGTGGFLLLFTQRARIRIEEQVVSRTADLRDAKLTAQSALAQVQSGQAALVMAVKRAEDSEHQTRLALFDAEMAKADLQQVVTVLREQTQAAEQARREAELLRHRAEAANQAKSAFLANMSHEIRTPMNGVLGMLALMMDETLPAEQRERLETAQASAESLLGVINDILDFSKIEAGRIVLERIDVDLDQLVESVLLSLAPRAAASGLRLRYIPAQRPLTVRSDPVRLRQVLNNLLGNAVKFTRQGEVCLRLHLNSDRDRQGHLRCTVSDTGCGIPADYLPQLFTPFSQSDVSTTRTHGGTGLGLSITKQLVALMGGEISVSSQPGIGSVFTVSLPLAELAPIPSNPSTVALLAGGTRILLRSSQTQQLAAWSEHFQLQDAKPECSDLSDAPPPAPAGGGLCILDHDEPDLATVRAGWRVVQVRETYDISTPASEGPHLRHPVRRQDLNAVLREAAGLGPLHISEPAAPLGGHLTMRIQARQWPWVLVVDDNPVNRTVACALLGRLGCRTATANDGQQALEILATRAFAVVFMDCQMPVMDGYEATRRIRAGQPCIEASIPIIALTAHAMAGDRERCLTAGMDDYLSKPIQPTQLAELLDRWLPGARQAGTPPPDDAEPA
jgi:signal transduction histidine kinase/ActR/RegA family two-component response regulator